MKIDFEFDSEYGVFRDALHLPDDVTYTEAEIDAMKQARFDNWIYHIQNPPPVPEEPVAPPADPSSDYITVNGVTYKKV